MIDSLEQFLEGSRFYDFPSFPVAVFSLLLAFVLSSLIAFTYKLTFKGVDFPNHFFQAMVLSSLVSGMIMMAVGSNFAVGFGIIGAVAIIRFRTLIQDPRNIIFMFAAISIGIATGVYGYAIAIAGTLIFCSVSFVLFFTPFSTKTADRCRLSISSKTKPDIEVVLSRFCKTYRLETLRQNAEGDKRFDYVLNLYKGFKKEDLFAHLCTLEELSSVRIDYLESNTTRL